VTNPVAPHSNPLLADIYRTPDPPPLPAGIIRLDRNERVPAYDAETAAAIARRLTGPLLSQYPDASPLYVKLAQSTAVPVEQLLLVPGSDAAFRALAHAFVQPGDQVVMIAPSYQMYPIYARMFGGVACEIPVRDDLTVDVQSLRAATTQGRMLWLANPNQPSGTLISTDDVLSLVRDAARSNALVVVDEAYYPFSRATVVEHVARHENLIVVRTFSKACGLAGARLGFVAASRAVIAELFKVRTAFDINALAIAAGEWAVDHADVIERYVRETEGSRDPLVRVAARHGLAAPASATNFQLIKVAPHFEPAAIKHAAWQHGYAISTPSAGVLRDYIRITIGAVHVIEPFAAVLDRILTDLA
jgi:histidinol-phosphate aminotransferase